MKSKRGEEREEKKEKKYTQKRHLLAKMPFRLN